MHSLLLLTTCNSDERKLIFIENLYVYYLTYFSYCLQRCGTCPWVQRSHSCHQNWELGQSDSKAQDLSTISQQHKSQASELSKEKEYKKKMSPTTEREEGNWEQLLVWEGKSITEKYDMFSLRYGKHHFPISIEIQLISVNLIEPFSTSAALYLVSLVSYITYHLNQLCDSIKYIVLLFLSVY